MSNVERTVMVQLPTMLSGALTAVEGTVMGRVFELSAGTFTIGRNDAADLPLVAEPGVSKVHAKITAEGDHYVLVDCESRNGTIVNGSPVQRIILKDGDEIRVCGSVFRFAQRNINMDSADMNTRATEMPQRIAARDHVPNPAYPSPPPYAPQPTYAPPRPTMPMEPLAPPPSSAGTLAVWYGGGLASSLLLGGALLAFRVVTAPPPPEPKVEAPPVVAAPEPAPAPPPVAPPPPPTDPAPPPDAATSPPTETPPAEPATPPEKQAQPDRIVRQPPRATQVNPDTTYNAVVDGVKPETLLTTGGIVKSVEVSEGDSVKKGQTLITFEATANPDAIQTLKDRIASLEGQDSEDARRQRREAQSALDALLAGSGKPVVAGMSGKITGLNARVGQSLASGATVGRISDGDVPTRVKVTVGRNLKVSRGDSVQLRLRDNSMVRGTVKSVDGTKVIVDTNGIPGDEVDAVTFE